jgi:hypothetical protein
MKNKTHKSVKSEVDKTDKPNTEMIRIEDLGFILTTPQEVHENRRKTKEYLFK